MEEQVKSKELEIVRESSHLKLRFKGGGELPDSLKGIFTRYSQAEKAIAMYKESKAKG